MWSAELQDCEERKCSLYSKLGSWKTLGSVHCPRTKSLCIPRRETDENVCPPSNSSRWESARCFRLGRQSCQRHPRPSLWRERHGQVFLLRAIVRCYPDA